MAQNINDRLGENRQRMPLYVAPTSHSSSFRACETATVGLAKVDVVDKRRATTFVLPLAEGERGE